MTFLGSCENQPFYSQTGVATFWVTFGKTWATFYFNIWSHWLKGIWRSTWNVSELPSQPTIYNNHDGNNNNNDERITDHTSLINVNETMDLKCESSGGKKQLIFYIKFAAGIRQAWLNQWGVHVTLLEFHIVSNLIHNAFSTVIHHNCDYIVDVMTEELV